MDRDISLQINQKITNINTALQSLVTNTIPTASDNRLSENRSIEESIPVESEPVEPETRNKK